MLKERQAAVEAILKAGHIPAGMELFTAGDKSQWQIIKKWIDESDIFVLILGGRYGTLEPKSKRSYIELEYRHAESLKKPLFAIVIDKAALENKVKQYGASVKESTNILSYKRFSEHVLSKMTHFYRDEKDIQLSILQNIQNISANTLLSGWVSGRDVMENEKLLRENIALRKDLDAIRSRLQAQAIKDEADKKKYNGYSFKQLIQALSSLKTAVNSLEISILDMFIAYSDDFAIGVGNSMGHNPVEAYLYNRVTPTLLNYGLVEKVRSPARARWGTAQTSKLGHAFIAEYRSNNSSESKNTRIIKLKSKVKERILDQEKQKHTPAKVVDEVTKKYQKMKQTIMPEERLSTRVSRILTLKDLQDITMDVECNIVKLPKPEGRYKLYMHGDNCYALVLQDTSKELDTNLADMRVMMNKWKKTTEPLEFIIATNEDLRAQKEKIAKFFKGAMKKSEITNCKLAIWDNNKISLLEKRYHLKG